MKQDFKPYARLLLEVTEDVEKKDLPELISRFLELLQKHQMLSLLPKIIEEFRRLYNLKQGIKKARLDSVHKLSDNLQSEIDQVIKKELSAKQIEWEQVEDKELLGGFKVRVDDIVIDGSLKSKVQQLERGLKG